MAAARLTILSDVVRGLAHLHSCGVVHRDIKPANLLVDRGQTARIGDFGVARTLGCNTSGGTAARLHTSGTAGTCLYMSPEYKNGTCSALVDSFALGVVVLELLTGRHANHATEGEMEVLALTLALISVVHLGPPPTSRPLAGI